MWFLGIDFGTTMSTGAYLRDGRVYDVEHSGRNRIPSAVLLDEEGVLVGGDAALNQAAMFPDRVDRTPKESLGGPAPLLLGPEAVAVPRAVAQVLALLVAEGTRCHQGEPPARVALTHPARWSEVRTDALREAAALAGVPDPDLVPEPVAAAAHYAEARLDPGALVAVYDFGGGTFDAAILRRTDDAAGGFAWVGDAGGDEDIGGEDLDYRLYELVGEQLAADDDELWTNLAESDERMWRRANHLLMEEIRKAKESLSSYPTVRIPIPNSDRDVLVTREELERTIAEEVDATVDSFAQTLSAAGVRPDDLTVIYLAGGSSRIPLVSRRMTERFGNRITTADDPKLVVARGAARWAGRPATATPPAPVPHEPAPPPPGPPPSAPTWTPPPTGPQPPPTWTPTPEPAQPPPSWTPTPEPAQPPPSWTPEPAQPPPSWTPPPTGPQPPPTWTPTPEPAQPPPPPAPAWSPPPASPAAPVPAPSWMPAADDLYRPPTWSPDAPAAPAAPPAASPPPVTGPPAAPVGPAPPVPVAAYEPVAPPADPSQEVTLLMADLPRNGGRLFLTNTRLVRTDPSGSTVLDLPLADIAYVVTYGVGSIQVNRRSGEVLRISVGARQMMRWRTAVQQAMGSGY